MTFLGLLLGTAAASAEPPGPAPPLPSQATLSAVEVEEALKRILPGASQATVAIEVTAGGRSGFGSGAIVSPEGEILTCAHVVEAAEEIRVLTAWGEVLEAERLGLCARNDYALLRVPGKDLPHFDLAPAPEPRVGQWVVALGHPGGPYRDARPSPAIGLVTGLHRRLPILFNRKYYRDAIQIDCPIFPGNSGGPLLDLDGRLLGICGAILLVNEFGYAIPLVEVRPRLDALRAGQDVEGELPADMGVVVEELLSELRPEDFERLFGERFGRLFRRLLARGEGHRTGDPEALNAILRRLFGDVEVPGGKEGAAAPTPRPDREPGFLGMTVLEREGVGLVVVEVVGGSPAEEAGLLVGDVLVSFDEAEVEAEVDLAEAIGERLAGERIQLRIRREGWERTFEITLAPRPGEER